MAEKPKLYLADPFDPESLAGLYAAIKGREATPEEIEYFRAELAKLEADEAADNK